MKYFEVNKKPQVDIGHKIGCLTVCSKPYYKYPASSNKHRRQFFDCVCDCGKIKEFVLGRSILKKAGVLLFCDRNCKFYLDSRPYSVPEECKKCKINETYGYLTVIREAFYHQLKGETNRYKCIEVLCKCGKTKIYREDKVYKGTYKSCGCVWEHKDNKARDWNHLKRNYNLTKEDYEKLLLKQNNQCAICKNEKSQTSKTEWLFVDHCHETGKIRGLLCNQCNIGIGSFKDNISLMENAIKYILNSK